jgi:hypothetical protein
MADVCFVIDVEQSPDPSVSIDTLFHEWGHCLTWPWTGEEHSQEFFKACGRIYQRYVDQAA